MTGAVPWYDDVVQGPVQRVDGAWLVPTSPALGVDLAESVAAAHPVLPEVQHGRNAVMPDGTVVDW